MSKRLLGMLIAVVLIATMIMPVAMAATSTMYVKTNTGINLNVRSTPEVRKNNVLGSIPYGSAVQVDHLMTGGWAVINYNGKTAYVATRYLSTTKPEGKKVTPTATPAPATDALTAMNNELKSAKKVTPYNVVVNPARVTSWANLRWAPSTSARTQTTYKAGELLTVIATTTHWYQVQDSAGRVGFIHNSLVTTNVGGTY